jgi:hypothetical protein
LLASGGGEITSPNEETVCFLAIGDHPPPSEASKELLRNTNTAAVHGLKVDIISRQRETTGDVWR